MGRGRPKQHWTFSRMAEQTKKTNEPPTDTAALLQASSYTTEHLDFYFKSLFSLADVNGDGVLQPDELTALLEMCGFELSAEEIAQFVSAADANHDGVIEYEEFLPVASKMLKAQKGREVSATAAIAKAAEIGAIYNAEQAEVDSLTQQIATHNEQARQHKQQADELANKQAKTKQDADLKRQQRAAAASLAAEEACKAQAAEAQARIQGAEDDARARAVAVEEAAA